MYIYIYFHHMAHNNFIINLLNYSLFYLSLGNINLDSIFVSNMNYGLFCIRDKFYIY